jgi:2-C-methyl-D-erythritol 4-phosphate cytidylyltransferase/2-C-methyl-D-erythritol 2,4-cyclodiphosphate synthase
MTPAAEGGSTAVAILLAAGSGSRMGGDRPKAFLSVDGRALLTIAAEAACASARISSLVVAVPPGWEGRARALVPSRSATVVSGGDSRQESVRRALEAVPAEAEIVAVHDAARALATPSLFDAVLAAVTGPLAGAVPVVAVQDTVKRVEGAMVAETVPREHLALAQTPQAFLRVPLIEAHARAAAEGRVFTDDAALVEWAGGAVATVPGDPENFKVTTSGDLGRAEFVLRRRREG